MGAAGRLAVMLEGGVPAGSPTEETAAPRGWFWRDVFAPLVVTRIALTLVGMIAVSIIPMGHNPPGGGVSPYQWLDVWARWDAAWYVSVVQDGYSYQPGEYSNVAFAPLYPLLLGAVKWVIPGAQPVWWFVAGIVVSNASLLIALGYLVRLVRLDYGHDVAARTVLYLLVYPASLFLSAVYAESTFLALAVGAFYSARRGRWWMCGVLGFAAALARPHGVLMVVPLALEYLAGRQFRWRRVRADVLWLLLIPLAVVVLLGYFQWTLGDPFVAMKAQDAWGRRLMPPWETLHHFFSHPLVAHGVDGGHYSPIDLAFTAFFFLLTVASWKVLRRSYALYNTILFVLMLSTGLLTTNMRYGLALFPAFIVLAVAGRSRVFDRGYVAIAATLSGLFMALYSLFYWLA